MGSATMSAAEMLNALSGVSGASHTSKKSMGSATRSAVEMLSALSKVPASPNIS